MGRHCNGLSACSPVSCIHLPNNDDSWRASLLAECPRLWQLGQSGAAIRLKSHGQPSMKVESFACLTMSKATHQGSVLDPGNLFLGGISLWSWY